MTGPARQAVSPVTNRPVALWSPFGLYYGWIIVASALIINTTGSVMSILTFSFLIVPMGHDMGWSRGEMSLALTFRLLTAAVISPYLGSIIDRIGTRWPGAAAGLIAGVSLISVGFVDNLWMLYLVFAISGFAGFGGPAAALLTNVPVAKWFVVNRGRAMAVATFGAPVGVFVSIYIARWAIEIAGWRQAWMFFGMLILATVVPASALLMRRVPEDHGLWPDGAVAPPPAPNVGSKSGASVEASQAARADVSWTRVETFRHPAAWLILSYSLVTSFALSGTVVHRVSFWQDIGISSSMVVLGTAADPFTVIFSAVFFGMLAERVPIRYLGLVGGLGFGASMLPMIFTTGQTVSVFLHAITWGFFAGAFIATSNLVWANYFGRKSVGSIQGVVLPVSVTVNALSAPAYGYMLDAGIAPSLIWTASLCLFTLGGVLIFLAHPPRAESATLPAAAG